MRDPMNQELDDLRAENQRMRPALELADDVLRVVVKVYGPSPLVELTRGKIVAALGHQQTEKKP